VIPDGIEHPRWSEVVQFIAALGITLDPWQMRVLWASLLRGPQFWAAFVVAVCAPRQNGKNAILEVRELIGPCILGEQLVIHSAHRADTSMEGFRRLDDLIDANSWLSRDVRHIRRQNGHEQITFKSGNRIRFRTRQGGGGRGFSGSPVVFDESMYLSDVAMGSMLPVISAQPDPQVWHMGSAVDQMIHEEGVVFARVRERALEGSDDRLAYFEWSLDADLPDNVTMEQASDPEQWAQTNPALGVRITTDYVRSEQRELDARTFAVERLGVGDWPKTEGGSSVFDLVLWDKLIDPHSKAVNPVVFAFDVKPDRSKSTIAVVCRRPDGFIHMEVLPQLEGTGLVVAELVRLEREHTPLGIVCDGVGPASSLIPELMQQSVDVTVLTTPEVGKACGMFYDAVQQEQVRHLGSNELLSAIKGAAQRPLGDAWAWSRRNSSTDISPLVACTLGMWKVVTEEQRAPMFAFG
jgi:hypothetical protein